MNRQSSRSIISLKRQAIANLTVARNDSVTFLCYTSVTDSIHFGGWCMYAKIIQTKKHKNLLPQNQTVFQTPQVWLWCQVIVTIFFAKWLYLRWPHHANSDDFLLDVKEKSQQSQVFPIVIFFLSFILDPCPPPNYFVWMNTILKKHTISIQFKSTHTANSVTLIHTQTHTKSSSTWHWHMFCSVPL